MDARHKAGHDDTSRSAVNSFAFGHASLRLAPALALVIGALEARLFLIGALLAAGRLRRSGSGKTSGVATIAVRTAKIATLLRIDVLTFHGSPQCRRRIAQSARSCKAVTPSNENKRAIAHSAESSMTELTNFEVLTVGHSNLAGGGIPQPVKSAEITAVVDVRSVPFSRRHPWFSARTLSERLQGRGIAYIGLGTALGGRPSRLGALSRRCRRLRKDGGNERVPRGLDRVVEETRRHRVCLMCTEREPLDCHRCLLVGRALAKRGCTLGHILGDGRIEAHAATEDRLLARAGRSVDLFGDRAARAERGLSLARARRCRATRRPGAARPDAAGFHGLLRGSA